jgi:hypothetical protein
MSTRPLAALLAAAAVLGAAPAHAESPTEAKLRDALRAANAQLRTAEDDKATLQASAAALQKKVAALEAQLATATAAAKPKGNARAEAELRASAAASAEANAKLQESLARCEAAAREAADAGRTREQERSQLAAQVGPMGERLKTCEDRNGALFRLGREILDRYARVGIGDVLATREPFVGARRVELENLVQDYGDKLHDQLVAR